MRSARCLQCSTLLHIPLCIKHALIGKLNKPIILLQLCWSERFSSPQSVAFETKKGRRVGKGRRRPPDTREPPTHKKGSSAHSWGFDPNPETTDGVTEGVGAKKWVSRRRRDEAGLLMRRYKKVTRVFEDVVCGKYGPQMS